MTIEEQLKKHILSQYKSVRAFTQAVNIPYSTVDTMFKRGIGGTGINTVMKIFHTLNLDIESIETGCLNSISDIKTPNSQKEQLLHNYDILNENAQTQLIDYSEFLVSKQNNLKLDTPKTKMIRVARSADSKVTEIESDFSDFRNASFTDEDL